MRLRTREDVAIAHEGRVGSTHAGFSIEVTLPAGISEVSLEALNSKGEWERFLSHPQNVKAERPEQTGFNDFPFDRRLVRRALLYVDQGEQTYKASHGRFTASGSGSAHTALH